MLMIKNVIINELALLPSRLIRPTSAVCYLSYFFFYVYYLVQFSCFILLSLLTNKVVYMLNFRLDTSLRKHCKVVLFMSTNTKNFEREHSSLRTRLDEERL